MNEKNVYSRESCQKFYTLAGEACWWTVHPASKQRSEGEKVRVGDDLILVSVATERYLVSSSQVNKNNGLRMIQQ